MSKAHRGVGTLGMDDAKAWLRNTNRSSRRAQEYMMNATTMQQTRYELRFQPLFDAGRAFAFPCDASGHVDMDALSDKVLNNYLYARTVVGREFLTPSVQRSVAR
jgi:hypothetical protein